jgi:hypothetical protein
MVRGAAGKLGDPAEIAEGEGQLGQAMRPSTSAR